MTQGTTSVSAESIPAPEELLSRVEAFRVMGEDFTDTQRSALDTLAGIARNVYGDEGVLRLRRIGTAMLDNSAGLPHVSHFVTALGGQLHEHLPVDQRAPLIKLEQVAGEIVVRQISATEFWNRRIDSILG